MQAGFAKADARNLPEVNAETLWRYIKSSPLYVQAEARGVKMSKCGRESYGDQAVGYVQLKRYEENHESRICEVVAKVCPEHKTKSTPYKVTAKIREFVCSEKENAVISVTCDSTLCIGSACGCKHAHALITWLHRRSEDKAVTSIDCYWKKPRLKTSGDKARTAETLQSSKKHPLKNKCEIQTGTFLNRFVVAAHAHNSNNQIMLHFKPLPITKQLSMHHLVTSFKDINVDRSASNFLNYVASKLTDSNISLVQSATIEQSDNPGWFHIKYGRISGSRLHEVAQCQTVDGVTVEKFLGAKKFSNVVMKRGLNIEKDVLQAVSKLLLEKIENCGFLLSREHPAFGVSPDGISDMCIFEVKCPSKIENKKYYITNDGNLQSKVYAQMQLEMHFAEKKEGYLCLADPKFEKNKSVDLYPVKFNEKYVLEVMEKALAFWVKNVYPLLLGD